MKLHFTQDDLRRACIRIFWSCGWITNFTVIIDHAAYTQNIVDLPAIQGVPKADAIFFKQKSIFLHSLISNLEFVYLWQFSHITFSTIYEKDIISPTVNNETKICETCRTIWAQTIFKYRNKKLSNCHFFFKWHLLIFYDIWNKMQLYGDLSIP